MEIFDILGPHSHPSAPIDVKCCRAKRTQVAVGPAKFDPNRCNESPLRGEKPDFWPGSKTIPAVCRYAAILPIKTKKHHIFAPTVGAHCAIFTKLCMVIELVVPIVIGVIDFLIQRIVFPTGCTEKFGLIYRRAVSPQ